MKARMNDGTTLWDGDMINDNRMTPWYFRGVVEHYTDSAQWRVSVSAEPDSAEHYYKAELFPGLTLE